MALSRNSTTWSLAQLVHGTTLRMFQRVSKKGQLRRDSVATKRYCLCYNVKLSAKHGIDLVGKKVSLPFAILVGPKTDVEAKLFLERSFADLVRKPLSDVPQIVPYQDMADALEMKFQVTEILVVHEPARVSTEGDCRQFWRRRRSPPTQYRSSNRRLSPTKQSTT